MQLDLWELYDIETVNVTHFFTDGRTFFDTKTEVSADGVNWTTIFDSAVDGTYVETSEGRSYEVGDVWGNIWGSEDEYDLDTDEGLNRFLEDILWAQVQSSELNINTLEPNIATKKHISELLDSVWSLNISKMNLIKQRINIFDVSWKSNPWIYQWWLDYITLNLEQRINNSRLHILEHEYTENIEDWFIGGFYFKVNNPDLVREAGVEYHTKSFSSKSHVWEEMKLPNWDNWNFSAFIFTYTPNITLRWYVIDINGTKKYTKKYWNTPSYSKSTYESYGNIPLASLSGEDSQQDWVQTSAIPLVAYGVLALFNAWLTVYDTYTTIQDCKNDDFVSINCAVDLWLSVIPIKWWKQAKNVLEFIF